jgi:hypothetical protein
MTSPHEPTQTVVEASAWFRKQLLDGAYRFADQFVVAMRAEGITDEVIGRVLDRIVEDVPDPDVVIPPGEGMVQRARRASEQPIRRLR